jgi:cysteine desulfurase
MLKFPIYLDYHSTTPVDQRVIDAMLPYFTEKFGNASSKSHEFGWIAEAAVENARKQTARLINAEYRDVIFTSGATESVNLAIKGIADSYLPKGNHIITSAIEHEAVLDSCKSLERKGFEISYIGVDEYGLVDIKELKSSIKDNTILVSVMYVNNEIGTIQPVDEIAAVCKSKGVLFHTDATQAVGRIPVDVVHSGIDLMSFSSHKIYGPKGVGAFYIKSKFPKIRITPRIDGGSQERGFRAGTLNVPGIVGFGKACEIAKSEMEEEMTRITLLRDRLYNGIISGLTDVKLNGHPAKRIGNNLNLTLNNVDSDALLIAVKEIALSTGSACSSESFETSHVLKAINSGDSHKHSAIRFGLGRFTTEEEIEYTVSRIVEKAKHLREVSPLNTNSEKEVYAKG